MAAEKRKELTVPLSTDTSKALDARRLGGESREERLATDIKDYYAMLDRGLRKARLNLSPAEAAAVLDAHPRVMAGVTSWTSGRLAKHIEEACLLDGIAEKWAVDGLALVAKLKELGDCACIALADWAVALRSRDTVDVAAEIAVFKGQD